MTGSNRRPSACKADALPAELILHYIAWQRPTLTGGEPPTTIGAEELNFRVRYGNGCDLLAIVTKLIKDIYYYNVFLKFFKGFSRKIIPSKLDNAEEVIKNVVIDLIWLSPRSISICQLHVSPRFHPRPINLIIFQGSY